MFFTLAIKIVFLVIGLALYLGLKKPYNKLRNNTAESVADPQSEKNRRQESSPDYGAVSLQSKPERQSNPARFYNRLGGWERLFVVVSISWLVIASTTYFLALDGNPWCERFVPESAFIWAVDLFTSNPDFAIPVPVFSGIGFSTFVIAPIVLTCCVAYIGVRVFQWVREGFQR